MKKNIYTITIEETVSDVFNYYAVYLPNRKKPAIYF